MATADSKPKGKSFLFLEEEKNYPALAGLCMQVMIFDI